jgi:hypothetical protein
VKTFFYNFKNGEGLKSYIRTLDPTKVWRIRIDEYDEQTRLQQEKYHAMIGDVAAQCMHLNRKFDAKAWKRLLVHQFRSDCISNHIPRLEDYWKRNDFELIPALDGRSIVNTGEQTRDWPKYVSSAFVEWLYHYGAENSVEWSEPDDNGFED